MSLNRRTIGESLHCTHYFSVEELLSAGKRVLEEKGGTVDEAK